MFTLLVIQIIDSDSREDICAQAVYMSPYTLSRICMILF